MVASRWRLDSRGDVRDAVDALVRLVDTEKGGCCGWLTTKMEAVERMRRERLFEHRALAAPK